MTNPYLQKFRDAQDFYQRFDHRSELVRQYAWAVPTPDVVAEIVKYSPIIEIGAGTGYWARQIQLAGGNVLAFDKAPPGLSKKKNWYDHQTTYFNVQRGRASKIKKHPDRTLFLCWPPYSTSLAHDCLSLYRGNVFLYVGEDRYGCNGDRAFWKLIGAEWEEERYMEIPQWDGLHDNFHVFTRKGKS
jgi:hypothetical protein